MTGAAVKTASRKTSFAASERTSRRCADGRSLTPAIAEPRVILDPVEARVEGDELLADAFDEGADVGAIAVTAVAGDEVLAMHEIIELPIGHVLPGALGQEAHHAELGQRQLHLLPLPGGAI